MPAELTLAVPDVSPELVAEVRRFVLEAEQACRAGPRTARSGGVDLLVALCRSEALGAFAAGVDRMVRRHPYRSAAVVFGLGVWLGGRARGR